MRADKVILGPILSERGLGLQDKQIYSFKVDKAASKDVIRKALKAVFDVDAVEVNTSILRGKMKRRMRHKGAASSVYVKAPNVKKAFVKLKAGQTLPTPVLSAGSDAQPAQAQA